MGGGGEIDVTLLSPSRIPRGAGVRAAIRRSRVGTSRREGGRGGAGERHRAARLPDCVRPATDEARPGAVRDHRIVTLSGERVESATVGARRAWRTAGWAPSFSPGSAVPPASRGWLRSRASSPVREGRGPPGDAPRRRRRSPGASASSTRSRPSMSSAIRIARWWSWSTSRDSDLSMLQRAGEVGARCGGDRRRCPRGLHAAHELRDDRGEPLSVWALQRFAREHPCWSRRRGARARLRRREGGEPPVRDPEPKPSAASSATCPPEHLRGEDVYGARTSTPRAYWVPRAAPRRTPPLRVEERRGARAEGRRGQGGIHRAGTPVKSSASSSTASC